MNAFVTFEENVINALKILKKQNATDKGQKIINIVSPQIKCSVPISHAYHLPIRIYFPRLPLYSFVEFTFSYSKQHYS